MSIADIAYPQIVDGYATTGLAQDIAVEAGRAYVAQDEGDPQIFEVTNPLNPTWVTGVDVTDAVQGLVVMEKYAFRAVGRAGLVVVDIANPCSARRVATLRVRGDIRAIHLCGERAYLRDGDGTVVIVDIHEPTQASVLGRRRSQASDHWAAVQPASSGDVQYLTGHPTLHEARNMPAVTVTRNKDGVVRLRLPKDLPLGAYDIVWSEPSEVS